MQGVVANKLNLHRQGAVGFLDWLDVGRRLIARAAEPGSAADGIPDRARLGAGAESVLVCRQIQPTTRTRSQTL
jgi:hypothetical protein